MAEMTSAERVMAVFGGEVPDRIPHFEWIVDKSVREALCPGSDIEEFTVRMGLDAMLTDLKEAISTEGGRLAITKQYGVDTIIELADIDGEHQDPRIDVQGADPCSDRLGNEQR